MHIATANTAPSKLYALQLKLRPLERGTLMPFSGELVHGAWLNWIRRYAPEVSEWLHEGNKRRVFTCSSLQFPLSPRKIHEAEQHNIHLPVVPEKTYTLRITLLLGELFPLFYDSLMRFYAPDLSAKQEPFIQLGKRVFLLEEVIAHSDDSAGWTGATSFSEMVAAVKQTRLKTIAPLPLEFATLTTFNRSGERQGERYRYHARLPLPQYVFPGLARRWQELAPPELSALVQRERIEQYIQEDGVTIEDYHLAPHHVHFVNFVQRGFIGTCTYALRGPDEAVMEDGQLTIRQQILLLARLAFYTGVGYKPAMGMGQCRCPV